MHSLNRRTSCQLRLLDHTPFVLVGILAHFLLRTSTLSIPSTPPNNNMQVLLVVAFVAFASADLSSDCRGKASGDCSKFYDCCFTGGAMSAGCCPVAFSDPKKTYCGGGGSSGGGGGGSEEPQQDDATFKKEILDTHNAYRKKHGAPAMTNNGEAEAIASAWALSLAETGEFKHNPESGKKGFGENIFMGTGPITGKLAVDSWYGEIEDYDFNNPGFSMATGHFTQVVWKASTGLGCGKATSAKNGATYVVCNYKEAGNSGDYKGNVAQPQ